MSRHNILIASQNKGKIKEIQAALELPGVNFEVRHDLPSVDEDGCDFFENALKKAKVCSLWSGLPALADDSGLEVDALNGAPGIYSARFSGPDRDDIANNEKLLRLMDGIPPLRRGAAFRAVIVIYFPSGEWVLGEGICRGVIMDHPKGKNGFGYDPLFFLPHIGRTMAELSPEQKNTLSHRALALQDLREKLLSPEFFHLLHFTP
jgi:XTP/dITP diphosphohydrolase